MQTLVLSQGYQPLAKISWQRAITLFFQGKAEILEEYEDREVRSVSVTLKMPSVIRFLKWSRGSKKGLRFSRENVYARDRGQCQYCGVQLKRNEATYDHVVPRKHGGLTGWGNIVISCFGCNQKKGGRTPEQARMVLRSKPTCPTRQEDTVRITFSINKDTPTSWRQYLGDMQYWYGELESD